MQKNILRGIRSTACWGMLACALAAAALSPPARGQQRTFDPVTTTITDSLPLLETATLLGERYGAAVTYEDPVWPHRVRFDLVNTDPGEMAALKALQHSLVLPKGLTPAENPKLTLALLTSVVEAYHAQNPARAHYRAVESNLGLHIAPVSVPDAAGAQVPAVSLLDARITVPQASRTVAEHINAICAAVSAATGVRFKYRDYPNGILLFDYAFAANGYAPRPAGGIFKEGDEPPTFEQARPRMVFTWGTQGAVARDALLDLLDRSATAMRWDLICPLTVGAPGTRADFPCNIWLSPLGSGSSAKLFDRKMPSAVQ